MISILERNFFASVRPEFYILSAYRTCLLQMSVPFFIISNFQEITILSSINPGVLPNIKEAGVTGALPRSLPLKKKPASCDAGSAAVCIHPLIGILVLLFSSSGALESLISSTPFSTCAFDLSASTLKGNSMLRQNEPSLRS